MSEQLTLLQLTITTESDPEIGIFWLFGCRLTSTTVPTCVEASAIQFIPSRSAIVLLDCCIYIKLPS